MARIIPIDVIKGISGKYGNGSNDYFATNKSSNKVRLAKLVNPYTGPATEKQLAQREKFAIKQAACTAWLNANRPNEKNGIKGTADYQLVQKMKRAYAFSNINQVLYKYMDEHGNIKLPNALGDNTPSGSPSSGPSKPGSSSSGNTDSGTTDSGTTDSGTTGSGSTGSQGGGEGSGEDGSEG